MRTLSSYFLVASFSMLLACGGAEKAPTADAPDPAATPAKAPEAPATKAPAAAAPQGPSLALVSEGSSLGFIARKNDEADVPGSFTNLDGAMTVPGGDLSKARGNLSIGWIGGVDTKNPARDNSIISVFFGALDATAPEGQVSLNSLEVESPNLAVGASTTGNAFVDVGAGLAMYGLAAPVTVTRDAESKYTVVLGEGVTVSVDKLGMGERKATLMEVCQHKSVGDAIKIAGTFVFGQ